MHISYLFNTYIFHKNLLSRVYVSIVQHKIYTLNKEINSLKTQRNQIVREYNDKIKEIKRR